VSHSDSLWLDDPLTQLWEILSEATPSRAPEIGLTIYQAETSPMVRDDDDVTPELRRRRSEGVGSRLKIAIVAMAYRKPSTL